MIPPLREVRCICGRWIANSRGPANDGTEVTCPRCGRYGAVKSFWLRVAEEIRHGPPKTCQAVRKESA